MAQDANGTAVLNGTDVLLNSTAAGEASGNSTAAPAAGAGAGDNATLVGDNATLAGENSTAAGTNLTAANTTANAAANATASGNETGAGNTSGAPVQSPAVAAGAPQDPGNSTSGGNDTAGGNGTDGAAWDELTSFDDASPAPGGGPAAPAGAAAPQPEAAAGSATTAEPTAEAVEPDGGLEEPEVEEPPAYSPPGGYGGYGIGYGGGYSYGGGYGGYAVGYGGYGAATAPRIAEATGGFGIELIPITPVTLAASSAASLAAPVTPAAAAAAAPKKPTAKKPPSDDDEQYTGPRPNMLTFDKWPTGIQADRVNGYAGLLWTNTQIYNGDKAIGENLMAAVRSEPNALVFEPNSQGVVVAVPNGLDRVFAPYSAWFTYVEDYDDIDRDGVTVLFTAYDDKGKEVDKFTQTLRQGVPTKVKFPPSFRAGIKRMHFNYQGGGSVELAMDNFAVRLPFTPPPPPPAKVPPRPNRSPGFYGAMPNVTNSTNSTAPAGPAAGANATAANGTAAPVANATGGGAAPNGSIPLNGTLNGTVLNATAPAANSTGGEAVANGTGEVFPVNGTSVNSTLNGTGSVNETAPANGTANVTETVNGTVNGTDVNATVVNATVVNATVVNATDVNATVINVTAVNVTAVNETAVNGTAADAAVVNGTAVNATSVNETLVNATPVNITITLDTPAPGAPVSIVGVNSTEGTTPQENTTANGTAGDAVNATAGPSAQQEAPGQPQQLVTPPGGRLLAFDDLAANPSGREPISAYGGLYFNGASAVTTAALPDGLRAGVVSPPAAITNVISLPGTSDASISISPGPNKAFTPRSVVVTSYQDPQIASMLGLSPASASRVIVLCYSPSGQQSAAGTVLLTPGAPGRVTFPESCAGAARVAVVPSVSSMQVVLDDLLYS